MSLNGRNSCTILIRLSMTSEYLSARNSNLVTLSTLPKFLRYKQLNFEATVLKCSNCLVMLFIIQSSAEVDLHFAGPVHIIISTEAHRRHRVGYPGPAGWRPVLSNPWAASDPL